MSSFFGRGFAGGLAAGAALGKSWVNTYNEADQQRKGEELAKESEALSKKMDDSTTYKANGLAMPDQQTAKNYADYNNKINAEDEQTFGGGLSSAPKTTVNKDQTYTRADYYADMGKKASGLGMLERGEAYAAKAEDVRDKEWQRNRIDAADTRAQEAHDQSMAKGKIDLDRVKSEEESRQLIDGFNNALSDEYSTSMKAGKQMPLSRIKELAVKYKLKPEEMLKAYSNVVGMDEAETGAVIASRARIAREAARGGLDNMVKVYETNPMFNDGMKLEVKRGKDGQATLLQNGKKLFSGSEQGAMGYMLKWVADPMSAFEYDAQVRTAQLQQRKLESEIGENNAQQASALASAAKTRAEAGIIKTGGAKPDDVRQNAQAAVKQVLLATGLAKQDQMGNLFMQAVSGQKGGSSEQEIADLSAQAEELVRQGMPPFKAAQQVVKGRKPAAAPATAVNQNRKPLSTFSQ